MREILLAALSPFAGGQHVLIVRNGWFSYRWTQIFEMAGVASSSTVLKARRAQPGSAAVFVDGSVTQGKPAGVGVWYGVGHPLNFAAALPSPTFDDNNLAELAAVFVALIRHPRNAPMKIHTDSAYVIQTLNPDRSPTMNRCRRSSSPARRSGDGSAARSAAARRALTRAARLLLRWRAAATSFRKVSLF